MFMWNEFLSKIKSVHWSRSRHLTVKGTQLSSLATSVAAFPLATPLTFLRHNEVYEEEENYVKDDEHPKVKPVGVFR